jgi:hypothetical protein
MVFIYAGLGTLKDKKKGKKCKTYVGALMFALISMFSLQDAILASDIETTKQTQNVDNASANTEACSLADKIEKLLKNSKQTWDEIAAGRNVTNAEVNSPNNPGGKLVMHTYRDDGIALSFTGGADNPIIWNAEIKEKLLPKEMKKKKFYSKNIGKPEAKQKNTTLKFECDAETIEVRFEKDRVKDLSFAVSTGAD